MSYLYRPTLAVFCMSLAFITACNPVPPSVVAADFSIDGVAGSGTGQNVTIDLSSKEGCYTLSSLTAKVQLDKDVTISPDPSVERDYSFPVVFIVTESYDAEVLYTVTVKGTACAVVEELDTTTSTDTTASTVSTSTTK